MSYWSYPFCEQNYKQNYVVIPNISSLSIGAGKRSKQSRIEDPNYKSFHVQKNHNLLDLDPYDPDVFQRDMTVDKKG
jgi:hypothetical protein